MRVTRRVLVEVSFPDNFFYAPVFFLFEVGGYAVVYGLKHGGVFLCYGGTYLDGGCACEEKFNGVLPCGYSAAADDWCSYFFVDVVDTS